MMAEFALQYQSKTGCKFNVKWRHIWYNYYLPVVFSNDELFSGVWHTSSTLLHRPLSWLVVKQSIITPMSLTNTCQKLLGTTVMSWESSEPSQLRYCYIYFLFISLIVFRNAHRPNKRTCLSPFRNKVVWRSCLSSSFLTWKSDGAPLMSCSILQTTQGESYPNTQ
jgi:hypothetical protein